MSCHKGDAVAKWSACWPGRQDFWILILAPLQATPPVTPEGMWCLFPSSVRCHRQCGRGLVGVLHRWGYAQASCLLLKLSALQSQTCLGLLRLCFLGNTALQSSLLECSAHSCLSFWLWYTLRTRKLLCASQRGGETAAASWTVSLRFPFYCL